MLTELGYDRVDVLGISWGGGVAQHFAAFQRSRCRRLVLVSTATGALMVPARPSVLATMVTPRRYTESRLPAAGRRRPVRRQRADRSGRVAAAMNAHNRVGSSRGYLYQLAAGAGWTSLPFLPLAAPADADRVRRRRPDHPARQRPAHAPADPGLAAARLPRRPPRPGHRGGQLAPVVASSSPHRQPAPKQRELGTSPSAEGRLDRRHRRRLLRARAVARRRRAPAPAAGPGVHGEVGRARHQPLLDQGGVPVRPDPGGSPSSASPASPAPGLRLPRRRQPARRHDRAGAGPGRPVHRDVHGRARRPGDGLDLPVRVGGAEAALAAGHGPDGEDRRVRADRARRRLGRRRRPDHDRAGATATSGCSTARRSGSATPPSPTT